MCQVYYECISDQLTMCQVCHINQPNFVMPSFSVTTMGFKPKVRRKIKKKNKDQVCE